jgi:hypothetical protein
MSQLAATNHGASSVKKGAGEPAHSIFQAADFTPNPLKLKAKASFSPVRKGSDIWKIETCSAKTDRYDGRLILGETHETQSVAQLQH